MVINHPQIMSWNVGIIKKRLNLDSTILLQDQKALSRITPLGVKPSFYKPNDELLAFLENL